MIRWLVLAAALADLALRTGGSLRVSGVNDGLSEAQQQNRKDGISCDGNAD